MKIINLTPHSVEVYLESQFVNLEQANPTTWFADEVVGDPLGHYPSEGVARMVVTTAVVKSSVIPGEVVKTVYGDPIGIPEDRGWDYLLVSLPMQSMCKSAELDCAGQMISPYKVVRSRHNGSLVLGCMGFTF